ncbi:MAG: hypothetical protein ACRDRU_14415 [Pseudonocardiaceae bacterium]
MTVICCPDYGARATNQKLTYEKTCPLGLALDERTDADRRWFEARPWASEYRRPLHWSERAELVMWGVFADAEGEAIGRVLVRRLGPGLRARSFGGVVVIVDSVVSR